MNTGQLVKQIRRTIEEEIGKEFKAKVYTHRGKEFTRIKFFDVGIRTDGWFIVMNEIQNRFKCRAKIVKQPVGEYHTGMHPGGKLSLVFHFEHDAVLSHDEKVALMQEYLYSLDRLLELQEKGIGCLTTQNRALELKDKVEKIIDTMELYEEWSRLVAERATK